MRSERRKMRRYAPQAGHNWAILGVGNHEYPVLLADESAGGFAITCGPHVKLAAGDKVTLSIHSGSFKAEVLHLAPSGSDVRVGLRLLEELPAARNSLETLFSGLDSAGRSSGGFLIRAAAMAFFVIVGLGGLLVILSSKDLVRNLVRGDSGRESTAEWLERARTAQVPGFEVLDSLMSDRTIAKLQMSEAQRKTVDNVFRETSLALAVIYERTGVKAPDAWAAQSSKVLENSLQRILCSMTEKQVQQWVSMITHRDTAPASDQARAR